LTQFLAAFDDVVIKRFNNDREEKEKIQVKYVYAPKERVLFDIVNKAQNITLPAIAVNISSITRDDTRVFNKLEGLYVPINRTNESNKFTQHIGMPTPVNISISMSIMTYYQTDMDQILSNFVPYANPYIIISWKIPSTFNLSQEQEIRSEVLWDGNLAMGYPLELNGTVKPRITADTTFIIKGWLFQKAPTDYSKNIFFINANFNNVDNFTSKFYTTYDDYASLSGLTLTYPASSRLYSDTELVSVSGSPSITNVFYKNANKGNNIFELYNNYTVNSGRLSGGIVTIEGRSFQYTDYVMLSSNVSNFYQTLTSFDFTYFPTVSGYILSQDYWEVLSPNVITVTLPTLTANGKFNIVVIDKVGWASTKSADVTFTKV